MITNYKLDAEDKNILDELDNLFGVVQNKDVLRDMIFFAKLRQHNEVTFGNYNIIIRNNSSYDFMKDLLKICTKVFLKYNIISNDRVCYLDKIVNNKKFCPFDKIAGIEDSIIVVNERKLHIDYSEEMDTLKSIIKHFNDKVFIFEDTSWCEGDVDAKLGELASWRMTIEKISLDDKIVYCKNKLDENNIKYKNKDLKDFSDVPFWTLRNMVMKLIIECKSKNITIADKNLLMKNKNSNNSKKATQRRNRKKNADEEKNSVEELNELIGLNNVKEQMERILNYIKLNRDRGEMPTLHMCFNGNPGTGKTSIARIIGKIFKEESILSGSADFVEIHGRDLVAKYVGWTAQQVHDIVESAIGGVLFIDEAYSLVSDRTGGFEDEAIATLIKEMEDRRNEVCIILAGYTDEMKDLIDRNPGFESRIQFTIDFPDYNEFELFEIFKGLCKKEKYTLSTHCKEVLIRNFQQAKKIEAFGNGRYVRNIFEKIKFEQADRVVKTNSKNINSITLSDVNNVLEKEEEKDRIPRRKIGFV